MANLNERFESVQKPTDDSRFLPSTLADRNAVVKIAGVEETDSAAVIIPITDIRPSLPKSASKVSSKKRRRDFATRQQVSEYIPEATQVEPQTANFFPSDAGQGILTDQNLSPIPSHNDQNQEMQDYPGLHLHGDNDEMMPHDL